MKKILAIALAMAMLTGTLSACSSAPASEPAEESESTSAPAEGDSSEAAPEAEGTVKQGGTLKIGVSSEHIHNMSNFSLTGAGVDYYYSWPVYESLFKPNENGSVDPWLLESYEMDSEAMTYTFNIRPGITFSDGTAFDAEALKWNLDHYLEVGLRVEALLSSVESTEIIDEDTVQLNLHTWSSIIPYAYSREPGYMTSPTFFNANDEATIEANPCGTGPFVMTNWEYDVSKRFEARDDYWGGDVNLDAVEYIIYTDNLVATAALQSEEIDALLAVNSTTADTLAASGGVNIGTCAVKSHDYLLVFNSLNTAGNDPTGDLLVRQAISHAINSEEMVAAVFGDYAIARNQFGVGEYFYSDTVQGYEYNPERAKELLTEAGYPDGFEVNLTVDSAGVMPELATIIQSYLAEVGITVNIKMLSGADANQAQAGWGDGMWLHGSSVYVSAPMQMASMFVQGLDGNVLGVTTMLRPSDVDAALRTSVAASSLEEELAMVGEANRLLVDEHCIFYNIAEVATLFAVNDYVMDSGIGEVFYSVSDLSNAWLDK